jgi:site-specific DNA-methyltransferase (adenine-specific)
MIFHGDCLTELKKIPDQTVDLIYLDPPFFTQKNHSLTTRNNSKKYSFDDFWTDIASYKNYIRDRLFECRRTLKNSGSIFLHCDESASHHLRFALDEVFGSDNFRSEIIWTYRRWSNSKKGLLNAHQKIFFYSKSKDFKFNQIFEGYSPTTNLDQIFQKRIRTEGGKTTYKKSDDGTAFELIEQKAGVPMSNVWEIPYLNPKANERVGYPTQKPIILLERIIQLASDKGNIVLDPFCGSGTTLVAALLLDRKHIGIDISLDAVELTKKRLADPIKSRSHLLENGKNSYFNQEASITKILQEMGVEPVQRNSGIDGFLKIKHLMKPIPVRIQRESETLESAKNSLLKASKKNGFKPAILLKTNNSSEPMLFGIPEDKNENLIIVENLEMMIETKSRLELIL